MSPEKFRTFEKRAAGQSFSLSSCELIVISNAQIDIGKFGTSLYPLPYAYDFQCYTANLVAF